MWTTSLSASCIVPINTRVPLSKIDQWTLGSRRFVHEFENEIHWAPESDSWVSLLGQSTKTVTSATTHVSKNGLSNIPRRTDPRRWYRLRWNRFEPSGSRECECPSGPPSVDADDKIGPLPSVRLRPVEREIHAVADAQVQRLEGPPHGRRASCRVSGYRARCASHRRSNARRPAQASRRGGFCPAASREPCC